MTATTALLATHDDDLVDTVLRCAAACGVEVELSVDAGAAVAGWGAVAAVLVGSDLAPQVARLLPPRRTDVVVLSPGVAGEADFRVALEIGAAHVAELPMAEEWLVEFLGDVADLGGDSGVVWGFIGGSGGVGSTTLACASASVAARDRRVALLDLDRLGPGADLLLGGEGDPGVRWRDLAAAPGRLPARSFREALPRRAQVGLLTFGGEASELDPAVVREAVSAARRSHDLVVVDLPRWPGGAAGAALVACDRVVLTVAATVGGVGSARRVLAELPGNDRVQLVVRASARGAGPDDVAAALGYDCPIALPVDRGLEEQIDLGLGPVGRRRSAVRRAAESVVERLDGIRR